MEWMAVREIEEAKSSRLIQFWRRKEVEESMKILRFLDWSLDSQGSIHLDLEHRGRAGF